MVTALLLVIIALLVGGGIWLFPKVNTLQSPKGTGTPIPQSVAPKEPEEANIDYLPVVYIENVLADVSFQDFVAGVLDPDEVSPAMQNLWVSDLQRLFDVAAVGKQALEASTRLGIEFTEKGQAALNSGGKLMEHGGNSLAVVTDSNGKIVEIGRIVRPSALDIGLSSYTFAVSCAWQLVARDLKKQVSQLDRKLSDLLELHNTYESAELEAAYETIRFVDNTNASKYSNEIYRAIFIAKQVRSRARQRLSNHSQKLRDPDWYERILSFKSWMEKDRREVDSEFSHLANIQVSIMIEAHALRILGDREQDGNLAILLGEESIMLREIGEDYRKVWAKQKKRQEHREPILLAAIEEFSRSLELISNQQVAAIGN